MHDKHCFEVRLFTPRFHEHPVHRHVSVLQSILLYPALQSVFVLNVGTTCSFLLLDSGTKRDY